MSSGKSKKKVKKSSGGGLPIIAMIAGAVVVAGLIIGGTFAMRQRGTTKEYDATIARITEQLKRDPDTALGPLKLSEIPALVTGNPKVTRETKDGVDYEVYQWDSVQQVGFRLKIEKNGPTEEVVELITLGATGAP